jgi:hypothetical protein
MMDIVYTLTLISGARSDSLIHGVEADYDSRHLNSPARWAMIDIKEKIICIF